MSNMGKIKKLRYVSFWLIKALRLWKLVVWVVISQNIAILFDESFCAEVVE